MVLSDEHRGTILLSTGKGSRWREAFMHPQANASNVATRHGAREILFAPSNPLVLYAGFAGANLFTDSPNAPLYTSHGVY